MLSSPSLGSVTDQQLREHRRFMDFREAYILDALNQMPKDDLVDILARSWDGWGAIEEHFFDDVEKAWKEQTDAE